NPARAHRERQIAAEDHDLLDDDGPGQDDVDTLRLEAANPPTLSLGETFESLPDGGDVGLVEPQPVAARAVAMRMEVDAGQRADGASETHHDLATRGGGQADYELRADLAAERSKVERRGRIVANETSRRPDGAERQARHRDDLAATYPAELEARAAQVYDEAVVERQALEGGVDAKPRLVLRAQDLHVDALVAPERVEQPLAVLGVPHGRRRDRDDSWPSTIRRVPREKAVHGPKCCVDRLSGQGAGRAAAQPRGHSLLDEHPIAGVGGDAGDQQADGGRAQIDDGDQFGRLSPVGAQRRPRWSYASPFRDGRWVSPRCGDLGRAREGPEDSWLEEPAEPPVGRRTVGKVHESRAALLEREPLALRGAEQAREQRPEERLVADERDPGAGRMSLQRGNDSVDARASKCRLDHGRDVREGTRGDVGGRPGAGKRTRQQQIWPTRDPGEPSRGHAELGLAVGS